MTLARARKFGMTHAVDYSRGCVLMSIRVSFCGRELSGSTIDAPWPECAKCLAAMRKREGK